MHPGTIDASAGLMMQFLDWVGRQPRTYGETMDAWRTSCPRISVWEDASLDGLVALTNGASGSQGAARVILTQAGLDRLAGSGALEYGGVRREKTPVVLTEAEASQLTIRS